MTGKTIVRAQRLRGEMTLAERLLWDEIRDGKLGLKFRRQHPVGGFVVTSPACLPVWWSRWMAACTSSKRWLIVTTSATRRSHDRTGTCSG